MSAQTDDRRLRQATKAEVKRSRRAGSPAGWLNPETGHLEVELKGAIYRVEDIAWLMVKKQWPRGRLEHIDGDPTNNRMANLREAL